jgi:hypothetical protein
MKRGGFEPETVAVAPTSTTVVEVDTRTASTLTLHVTNLDATQTFSGTIERRQYDGQAWAASSLGDFAAVGPETAVMADLDVSGTAFIRLVGLMDGAGGNVSVSGADRTAGR